MGGQLGGTTAGDRPPGASKSVGLPLGGSAWRDSLGGQLGGQPRKTNLRATSNPSARYSPLGGTAWGDSWGVQTAGKPISFSQQSIGSPVGGTAWGDSWKDSRWKPTPCDQQSIGSPLGGTAWRDSLEGQPRETDPLEPKVHGTTAGNSAPGAAIHWLTTRGDTWGHNNRGETDLVEQQKSSRLTTRGDTWGDSMRGTTGGTTAGKPTSWVKNPLARHSGGHLGGHLKGQLGGQPRETDLLNQKPHRLAALHWLISSEGQHGGTTTGNRPHWDQKSLGLLTARGDSMGGQLRGTIAVNPTSQNQASPLARQSGGQPEGTGQLEGQPQETDLLSQKSIGSPLGGTAWGDSWGDNRGKPTS